MKKRAANLGFGTASFLPRYGLGDGEEKSLSLPSLLREAVARGIRYIDTAADYGGSQKAIGELDETLWKSGVRLCTKISPRSLADSTGILNKSLELLHLKRADTLLLHSAQKEDLSDRTLVDRLRELREREKTRLLGASTYGAENALWALMQPWCDVVQVEHSILNPSVVRSIISSKKPGQEIVIRSVLCKGLMTSRRRHAPLSQETAAVLERLASLAKEWGFSLEELAIRFALDTEGVDVVLVGLSRSEELETAIAAFEHAPLQAWQMKRLDEFDCSKQDWSHPEKWQIN